MGLKAGSEFRTVAGALVVLASMQGFDMPYSDKPVKLYKGAKRVPFEPRPATIAERKARKQK